MDEKYRKMFTISLLIMLTSMIIIIYTAKVYYLLSKFLSLNSYFIYI